MYRVVVIVASGLVLAACSSTDLPSWMKVDMDAFKASPPMDTVRFESEPSGAEARTSTGQTCRTPCALAVPASGNMSVTFTLNGYRPETETLELITNDGTPNLRPNPVLVELTPAPPPPRKPTPAPPKKKPAPKPAPRAAAPAADPGAAAPGAAPWPSQPR